MRNNQNCLYNGLGSATIGLYDYEGTTYPWGGLRWEDVYKVVYFALGFEAIHSASSRTTVIDQVLSWLEG